MSTKQSFEDQKKANIAKCGSDKDLKEASRLWIQKAGLCNYGYNFSWLGRPIIQVPQDMAAMQEIIWQVKPDLIIETGIAHGGSLIFSASMLATLDYCDAVNTGNNFDPKNSRRKVLGIDIDIREHNRTAIESHPMAHKIEMIQGSSIDPQIIMQVKAQAANYERILVSMDSNHTHEHVLAELQAYAPLVTVGSYCVVFDTVVEDMPKEMFNDRPWGPGNNPKTAVWEYLKDNTQFEIDKSVQHKLLLTVAPDGYLKRIK